MTGQDERRQLAQVRRQVSVEPVQRRNRDWWADLCEFETGAEGVSSFKPALRKPDQLPHDPQFARASRNRCWATATIGSAS